jgi:5-histidylcysteine sulfoxide synthase
MMIGAAANFHADVNTSWDKNGLLKNFNRAWFLTEKLFSSLTSQAFYKQPDPRRNPLIFYYGHSAAFYINKLRLAGLAETAIDEIYDSLFAVGVDPENPRQLKPPVYPDLDDVKDYRHNIYEKVIHVINSLEICERVEWNTPVWALLMSIDHELIHFETSSVLLRSLEDTLLEKPDGFEYFPDDKTNSTSKFQYFDKAEVVLGRPANSDAYGWDNEFGSLRVDVRPFGVSNHMVTNGKFEEFVREGGYQDARFWSKIGWEWVKSNQVECPRFWIDRGGIFSLRLLFDVVDMKANWPVEVTAHEAEAYCSWKGNDYRLMSEAEWRLCYELTKTSKNEVNHQGRFFSPSTVGCNQDAPVTDLLGNVWDIIANDFYPLPGFRSSKYYLDFSTPYFGEKHGMMLGGSWASFGSSSSEYYRLWFRRDFNQHAGFRLAKPSAS